MSVKILRGYCGWFVFELIGVGGHGVCTDRVFVRLVLAHEINRARSSYWDSWPEVVAVGTELREVFTAKTKGQYSSVRLAQARLVNCLLYVTRFLIVKFTSSEIPS